MNGFSNSQYQIRVYYLDGQNKIREVRSGRDESETYSELDQSRGVYRSSVTSWVEGVILRENLRVHPGSQLTVARPDKAANTLRVYFQETGDNKYIRELKYLARNNNWGLQGSRMQGALEGSRLSAVSDRRTPGIVRLYYQGRDLLLCEGYWNENGFAQRKFIATLLYFRSLNDI